MPEFHIRTTPLQTDTPFILEAFDSALPHLASIGSAAQWGTTPRSTQPVFVEHVRASVAAAQSASTEAAVFVAEVALTPGLEKSRLDSNLNVEGDGDAAGAGAQAPRVRKDADTPYPMLQVAAAALTGEFAAYVLAQEHLKPLVAGAIESADFLYLSVLVSDFRAGEMRRGAGGALMAQVRAYARGRGKRAVWCDCWAGNGGKLVGYYEKLGFVAVGEFAATKDDGVVWEGKLLRMDVGGSEEDG
ncbi:hypothetical protein IQ07DRAFT_590145 [Pyrenochaeta sp. DS3sAY3a]|nr:hypothetical protein IQ07DRAFT_590145 [Pyrenochaeta sp. DS3sAY3a]